MNVRHLIARTPTDVEAEKRQLEKEQLLKEFGPGARHGRKAHRPLWLLRLRGKDSASVQFTRFAAHRHDAPEPSGRARHLAYRAAKRRAASR